MTKFPKCVEGTGGGPIKESFLKENVLFGILDLSSLQRSAQSNSVIIAGGHLDSGRQLMAGLIFTWKVVAAAAAAPDMSRAVGKDGKQKEKKEEEGGKGEGEEQKEEEEKEEDEKGDEKEEEQEKE